MASSPPPVVISAVDQDWLTALREVWRYRDLLLILAARQVSVRYKQTALGIAWVLVQPLVGVVIFTVVFGRLAHLNSAGLPYPVFVYTALVLWQLFADGLTRAGTSLIADEKLITKVYFPRLVIPLAAVGSAMVDFLVSLVILLPMTYLYGLRPTWSLLWLPLAMGLTVALAAGVGMAIAALNVRYRDFQYTVPFLIQVWLYASPVVYAVELVPVSLRPFYYLNPMAGLVGLARFAITGETEFSSLGLGLAALGVGLACGLGVWVFRLVERSFADYI